MKKKFIFLILIIAIGCRTNLANEKEWPPFTKNAILQAQYKPTPIDDQNGSMVSVEAEILSAIETKDIDKLMSYMEDDVVFGWHDLLSFGFEKKKQSKELKDKRSKYYAYLFDYSSFRKDELERGFDGNRSFYEALREFDKLTLATRKHRNLPEYYRKMTFSKNVNDRYSQSGKSDVGNILYLKCQEGWINCKIYMFEIP